MEPAKDVRLAANPHVQTPSIMLLSATEPGRAVSAIAWTDLDTIDMPPVDDIYIVIATASTEQLPAGIYRIDRTQLETIVGQIGAERQVENQTQNEQLRNLLTGSGTVENMPKKFAPENLIQQKYAAN